MRVRHVSSEGVCLDDGTTVAARAVVLATEAPETDRLLGRPPSGKSIAETCLYFACDRADWHPPYLMLNGDGIGPINNIVVPSRASPAYAPIGKSLFGAVILGNPDEHEATLINQVQAQLVDWFGPEAAHWQHLKTYRIAHALPDQSPPTQNPTRSKAMLRPGLFVCGETGSLPGIQWAMVSGRRAADAVGAHLRKL